MTQTKFQLALSGTTYALGAALFFGISTPLTKVFLNQIQPWMLAGLMLLGGGLGLVPIYLLRNYAHKPARLDQRDWGWLLISILFGGILGPGLLTVGLTVTPAAVASLLLNFEGVFTALLAWTVFRERWQWQVFLGIVAITSGGIILSHSEYSSVGLSWGAFAILGTCLGWAIDSNCTNQVADKDSLQISMLKSGMAGLTNVAIAFVIGQSLPSLPILLSVLSVGFVSYGLTLVCFVLSLRHLGASRTGAYFALSPFVGATIATVFLGERITQSVAIAAVLMTIGAGFCAKGSDLDPNK